MFVIFVFSRGVISSFRSLSLTVPFAAFSPLYLFVTLLIPVYQTLILHVYPAQPLHVYLTPILHVYLILFLPVYPDSLTSSVIVTDLVNVTDYPTLVLQVYLALILLWEPERSAYSCMFCTAPTCVPFLILNLYNALLLPEYQTQYFTFPSYQTQYFTYT